MNRAALHLGAIAMLSWGSQRILGRGKRFIAHGETAERRGPVIGGPPYSSRCLLDTPAELEQSGEARKGLGHRQVNNG